MKVAYLPLEPYEERYTLQLADWTKARFASRGIEVVEVLGDRLPGSTRIETGVVLDAHGRCHWALTQTARLVQMLRDGDLTSEDAICTQDLFHPGWEAVPYILDQTPQTHRPRCYTQSWAQSVDPNDFTFSMRRWMRHFEMLADVTHAGIFVASTCHVDLHRIAMFNAPIYVVGLPFDRDGVRARLTKPLKPWAERTKRIVFTSRFDREKQPHFFMDVVEAASKKLPDHEFAISTSAATLRSNEPGAVARARSLAQAGLLSIYEGQSKTQYYDLVADSRVHFNCALQDFVSFTMLEASAFGTPSLLPAYLSFPEAVFHERRQLYVPWSLRDAVHQLVRMTDAPPLDVVTRPADVHHRSLDRVADVLLGLTP
jgi:glycosyltransferase involved in cell wall biosynthesis